MTLCTKMDADSSAKNTPKAPEFICSTCLLKPKSSEFQWKKASLGVRSPWLQVQAQYYSDVFYVTLIISIDDENKKKNATHHECQDERKLFFFIFSMSRAQMCIFGILLLQLFWPTVREKCSSDREKLFKFETEGQEFAKFWDH